MKQLKGSDYLPYAETQKVGFELIKTGENPGFGLFILCGISFALRVSDLRKITVADLEAPYFRLREEKTGKQRVIKRNLVITKALSMMPDTAQIRLKGTPFMSQKGEVFSSRHLNRLMKKYLGHLAEKVSTHSLRKTFARDLYDAEGYNCIPTLQIILNHSNPADTLIYIGVTEQETDAARDRVAYLRGDFV